MWDTCTSHFEPKKIDRVGRGGAGKVKIGQNIAQNWPRFWLWSPLEAPKCVKDPWNGPQMIPPTAPDWFESISGVLDHCHYHCHGHYQNDRHHLTYLSMNVRISLKVWSSPISASSQPTVSTHTGSCLSWSSCRWLFWLWWKWFWSCFATDSNSNKVVTIK